MRDLKGDFNTFGGFWAMFLVDIKGGWKRDIRDERDIRDIRDN